MKQRKKKSSVELFQYLADSNLPMHLPAGRHSAPALGASLPPLGKARGRWDQVSHGLTSISLKEKHFKAAENTHFFQAAENHRAFFIQWALEDFDTLVSGW